MDTRTFEILRKINERFYETQAESFSNTRNTPWQGWACVLESVGLPSSVLDIASGNMRFQRFVNDAFPNEHIQHYCIDSCDALADSGVDVCYQHLDVVSLLADGRTIEDKLEAPKCDVCTSFGFMHHIPGKRGRAALLKTLCAMANEGGHVAVTFWRFADDETMRKKAELSTLRAQEHIGEELDLDRGDYLIGWNDQPNVYRYCHSFTDAEIDELLDWVPSSATVQSRFMADGKNARMNTYIVIDC